MRIYRPGLPVKYVDESPDSTEVAPEADPLPDVQRAMQLAAQRQGQVLEYTRQANEPSPLVNAQPEAPKAPVAPQADPLLDLTSSGAESERDPVDVELERLRAIVAAMESAKGKPHSVNDQPEVSK